VFDSLASWRYVKRFLQRPWGKFITFPVDEGLAGEIVKSWFAKKW